MFIKDEKELENISASAISKDHTSKENLIGEGPTLSDNTSNLEFERDLKASSELQGKEISVEQDKSKKSSEKAVLKKKKTIVKRKTLKKQSIPPADADELLTRKNL